MIKLDKEEIQRCIDFAEASWQLKNQSQKHFGGLKRTKNQFMADQIEGKLAEIIFFKFLKQKEIEIELDFNQYEGELNIDSGDFTIKKSKERYEIPVDIKGTSSFAQWLLVEEYKFIDINKHTHKSKAFILVAFNKNFPTNKELRIDPLAILNVSVCGEVRGWAKSEDFYTKSGDTWFEWRKGEQPWIASVLPMNPPFSKKGLNSYLEKSISSHENKKIKTTISIPLDAKMNYGLPIKWLNNDWNEFEENYLV